HNSVRSGAHWVHELLHGPSSRIRETLGMHKHVFMKLCWVLVSRGGLKLARYVGTTEQVALFL
ncbi:hypothetical protein CALVIDRAFT_472745, partial [Calocera viscosa TUFC12733]